jgi:hypothetical protein
MTARYALAGASYKHQEYLRRTELEDASVAFHRRKPIAVRAALAWHVVDAEHGARGSDPRSQQTAIGPPVIYSSHLRQSRQPLRPFPISVTSARWRSLEPR